MNREPLFVKGVLVAGATVLIALLVAFGLSLDEGRQVAILAVVAFVEPFVLAALARGSVTPVAAPRSNDGVPLVPAQIRGTR